MKWLLYLFSFYLLFLSGVPCSPDDACCMEEMYTGAPAGPSNGNKNNDKERQPEFPCSPFFACGANHGVVIPNYHLQLAHPILPSTGWASLYTENAPLIFIPSIWQPPKAV